MKQSTAILLAACLGYGMVILDTSVLNVALPAIATDTGASGAEQRWIIDAYVLVMTALLLAGGGLIDRFGGKRVFNGGIVVFAVASLICSFATDPSVLIAARALQGVGGALLIPATLTVVVTHFTEVAARGKAIAIIATVTASPQAFGPTLGGVLVESFGWRSVFLLNIPIAIITLILGSRISQGMTSKRRIDVTGVVMFAIALGAVAYAIINVSETRVFTIVSFVSIAVAVIAAISFVAWEKRAAKPLLPASMLVEPRVHSIVLAGTAMFVLFYGALFAANLYFQDVLQLSAMVTGLLLLPAGVPVFALPLVVTKVAKKTAPLTLALFGTSIATIGGLAGLLAVFVEGPVMVVISLFIVGVGFGIASPPHLNLATAAAPKNGVGVMSALANAGRQAGYLLGVAAVGSASLSVIGYSQAAIVSVAGGILAVAGLLTTAKLGRPAEAKISTQQIPVPE